MYYSSINKMTIIPNPGANLVIIVMGWNGNNLSTGGVGVRGGELLGGDHDDDNAFDDDGYRDHDGVGDNHDDDVDKHLVEEQGVDDDDDDNDDDDDDDDDDGVDEHLVEEQGVDEAEAVWLRHHLHRAATSPGNEN